jgi:hypothetical protein
MMLHLWIHFCICKWWRLVLHNLRPRTIMPERIWCFEGRRSFTFNNCVALFYDSVIKNKRPTGAIRRLLNIVDRVCQYPFPRVSGLKVHQDPNSEIQQGLSHKNVPRAILLIFTSQTIVDEPKVWGHGFLNDKKNRLTDIGSPIVACSRGSWHGESPLSLFWSPSFS